MGNIWARLAASPEDTQLGKNVFTETCVGPVAAVSLTLTDNHPSLRKIKNKKGKWKERVS